ncbi:MAG TPA: hypothetical protein VK696_07685 [Steroidobacteraceae bacterium]|jgi:LmbE family N-acetylglucosaminyl deacetylase|nr:hypothetical protein [Steroidobacteraceae bacterium]
MSLEGNIEYAATRVQSQHGARPDPVQWRRLETSHDLGQYLEGARGSLFGPWIVSLDRHRDVHDIERTLRGAWRHYVRSVAGWHPRCWQSWLIWLEWLPTLGLGARIADVEPAIAKQAPSFELWVTRWRALWPAVDADTAQHLTQVLKALREYAQQNELANDDSVAPRERLRARLERIFRAAAGTAVATLCHLGLMALDFERLRGGLVKRSLFAGGG